MRIIIEDDNDNDVIELLKNGKVSASCYFNVNNNIIDVVYDEAKEKEACESEKEVDEEEIKGKITVYSRLGDPNGALISSAKINLYMLNGISPKLIASKLTDTDGKVIFDNLETGSYRIISIVDRKYFEKPTYLNWNEVTIDSNLYEETITVINRIKHVVHKGKRE